MIDGNLGSAADRYRAETAAKTLDLFKDLACDTWKDHFWADATAVLAEETTEGLQQKLFDLAMSITAWDQAITQRRPRGNDETT